jgi:hypothetical protein
MMTSTVISSYRIAMMATMPTSIVDVDWCSSVIMAKFAVPVKSVRNYQAQTSRSKVATLKKELTSPGHLLGMDYNREQVEYHCLLKHSIEVLASFRNTS